MTEVFTVSLTPIQTGCPWFVSVSLQGKLTKRKMKACQQKRMVENELSETRLGNNYFWH